MNSKENSTGSTGEARISVNLIDAIDLLNEARRINEAAHMACTGMDSCKQRDAMQQIIGMCGDTLTGVKEALEALRFEASKGGAA